MTEQAPVPEQQLTEAQAAAIRQLCMRWSVVFDPAHYGPQSDLAEGWVAGFLGGRDAPKATLYIGVSPEGDVSS